MNTIERVLLCTFIAALAMTVFPLSSGLDWRPCQLLPRYMISYGSPGAHVIPHYDAFPGFPPLCMDAPSTRAHSL